MNHSWSFRVENHHSIDNTFDIDFLKQEIGSRFPYYEIKIMDKAVLFFCNLDKNLMNLYIDV